MTVRIVRGAVSRGCVVHFRKAPYDFYVGRDASTYGVPPEKDADLGNPFPLTKYTREQAIARFERYARNIMHISDDFKERIRRCHNKRLGCHCAPLACHGTVILRLAKELVNGVPKNR